MDNEQAEPDFEYADNVMLDVLDMFLNNPSMFSLCCKLLNPQLYGTPIHFSIKPNTASGTFEAASNPRDPLFLWHVTIFLSECLIDTVLIDMLANVCNYRRPFEKPTNKLNSRGHALLTQLKERRKNNVQDEQVRVV